VSESVSVSSSDNSGVSVSSADNSGVSVSSSDNSGVGVSSVGNSGVSDVVGFGVDGGSNGVSDDGLSLDGHGDGDLIGGINMDWVGGIDQVLLVHGDVIRDLNATFDIDGLVDGVDLGLGGDDSGVDGVGSSEDGGDGDGEMGCWGLNDPGGVSRHIRGLAKVDLLGDYWGGLVD
jgi:hypothetical protein